MEMISTTEAGKRKGVSRQAIIGALDRREFEGHRVGPRNLVIVADTKFRNWRPSKRHQKAGQTEKAPPAPELPNPKWRNFVDRRR